MEGSTYEQYQKMLEEIRTMASEFGQFEGRVFQARVMLFLPGSKRFGKPDARAHAAIETVSYLGDLEDLGLRVLDADVRGWDDLLGLSRSLDLPPE